jgi:tetratricopeptide (TPR) repeat protein
MPTLCLTMIVKNESKIIERLFESVLPIVDSFCICDTGSTDNTVEIIYAFLKKHNKVGKIVSEPFKNFSYNRNFALKASEGMADYLLLMDADMVLDIQKFNKNMLLCGNSFYILQGNEHFYYKNMRIIENNGKYTYLGVTHEYLNTPSGNINIDFEKDKLFIKDIGDGGSKTTKFERDVELLTKGIEDEPTNARYYFYLANTYSDLGQKEKAIELYKQRIKFGGWNQEVWYSYYKIGLCYKHLGKFGDALQYWLEGYDFFPDRLENLYEIVSHYRIAGKKKIGIEFYNICKTVLDKKIDRDQYLFLHNDVYTFKLYYEYTILAMYDGRRNINDEVVKILNVCTDTNLTRNLFSNMKFYKQKLIPQNVIDFSCETNITMHENIKMTSSSACIIKEDNTYILNIRLVNYTIDNQGRYHNCDRYIVTTNKFVILDDQFKILYENLLKVKFTDRKYIGVEDVRLFKMNNELMYIGTGYHANNTIGIVHGKYDATELTDVRELKQTFNNSQCEKNWVFVDYKEAPHIIYKWNPLQLCELKENTIHVVKEIKMPRLFSHARGSTCGFKFGNELWFVLHMVSYEEPRHYYHFMAVFDASMNLLRYSAPFTFKGEPIEYCLGLIVEENRVLITYSCWDRTTQLALYDKAYVEGLLYKV